MINVNEYFNGNAKSLAFNNSQGKFTAGVLLKGEYEFSTSSKEWMTLTAGKWEIELPNGTKKQYDIFEACEIPSGITFKVYALEDSSYLCRYV
ncbi:pyrimidine/purine nucleoside phosphorylase [Seonamhaeicola algicola]|uniref:Pyrimidine/purine nucleoside phosphorylase n=1 Tax=Seonamhaeicola algicola TaxID=1719036 RepID=A0A5C7AU33_9FLAO|nr:pyrimidine/purine nucleoside phosphorylase [Seonamhaeicola algicola]TXE11891.1 pyrimidine/purine nucleoside phosphorylase [Seonamhaeicola algicola]